MLTTRPANKKCFKCGCSLPLSEFYPHPRMADGHLNKCKECTKRDVRQHRRDNPSVRKYDRERRRDKEAKRQYGISYRDRYPQKLKAHRAVHAAVRRGDLVRKPCEQCGAAKVEAHHDDYSQPLSVRWLCPLCHRRWHANHESRSF